MKFLVTGGNGFIGSNLIRYLLSAGHRVCCYQRHDTLGEKLSGLDIQLVTAELGDSEALTQALADCQGVFHLAACGSSLPADEALRQQTNVTATAAIAAAVRQAGIRLVHVSSIAAIGVPVAGQVADEDSPFNNPADRYGNSKHQGEVKVLEAVEQGLDAVIVCPGSVVGGHGMKEGQLNTFKKIATGSMRVYPPGGLCLTDIDDLVRGMLKVFEKGMTGERYVLGGNNLPYRSYLEAIARATGGSAPRIAVPAFGLKILGLLVEKIFPLLGRPPFIDRNTSEMITKDLFYSSEKAKVEVGYTISAPDETIRKAVEIALAGKSFSRTT